MRFAVQLLTANSCYDKSLYSFSLLPYCLVRSGRMCMNCFATASIYMNCRCLSSITDVATRLKRAEISGQKRAENVQLKKCYTLVVSKNAR